MVSGHHTKNSKWAKIHPESLLSLPLVRQAMSDPDLRFQARGIDGGWSYQKVIPLSVAGFNPFLSTYFYPRNSLIAEWFQNPTVSSRRLNEDDHLVREVFFLVHDSLHAWAYRCIRALAPQLKLGSVPITKKNLDDYAFIHILTEAVATVGLDYWFLSTVHLNEVCDLGSNFKSLTVGYHQDHEKEYRRFSPSFSAQRPDFFGLVTRFYCDGIFPGFSIEDAKQSPRLLSWLRHELSYGETQRVYARSWLSFLSGHSGRDRVIFSDDQLMAPIDVSSPWRKRLIHDVGQLLWDKVKNGKEHARFARFDASAVWPEVQSGEIDFRFLNLNRQNPEMCSAAIRGGREEDRNFKHFFYQYLSSFDCEAFEPELRKLFDGLLEKKDFELIQHLFRDQKRLKPERGEPEHLFILN